MNIAKLLDKQALYMQNKNRLPETTAQSYAQAFAVEYTHNSTAIEGNTLSLIETKVVLEDKLAIGGKPLREIYEVVNHNKAFQYILRRIGEGMPLDEAIVKDIHAILMEGILMGGIYRNQDVYISGARHTPPSPNEMYRQVKAFYAELTHKRTERNAVAWAAWSHAEFVRIHPFVDGNGRASRLIMNYQLMDAGFLPISIAKERRLEYFTALEAYAVDDDLTLFTDMIAELEEVQLDRYLGFMEQEPQIHF